jgi:hypothetical protein
MKTFATVLVLLAFFALAPSAQCMAETPPAAPAMDVADFLATLSESSTPGVEVPLPRFLSTSCTSNEDCPTGQLCCYPCGAEGCEILVCMTPVRGRCPVFP